MKVSPEGRAFIESFEGFVDHAYLCPAGVLTIGYGHTQDVRAGQVITRDEAEALLDRDLSLFGAQVGAACGPANPHEFDALVSLAFNIGIAGFLGSTVLRLHRAGNQAGAAGAFSMWNKATIDGVLQPVAGLARRRAAEAALYLTPQASTHEPMPQAVAPPPSVPPGYEVLPSGNVVLGNIGDSTIVAGANHGAIAASAGTVASIGAAVSSFAGLDWRVLAVLGAIAIAGGALAIVYLLLVRSRRIEMHDRGIA